MNAWIIAGLVLLVTLVIRFRVSLTPYWEKTWNVLHKQYKKSQEKPEGEKDKADKEPRGHGWIWIALIAVVSLLSWYFYTSSIRYITIPFFGSVSTPIFILCIGLAYPIFLLLQKLDENPVGTVLSICAIIVVSWIGYWALTGTTLKDRFESGWFNRHHTYTAQTEDGEHYWMLKVSAKSFEGSKEYVILETNDQKTKFFLQQTPGGYTGHWEYQKTPTNTVRNSITLHKLTGDTWRGVIKSSGGNPKPVLLF